MKKLLCYLMCILIAALPVISFSVSAVQADNPAIFSDSSGIYIIRYNGKNADISCYGTNNRNISLRVNERIDAVYASFGRVICICNDSANQQLVFSVYDIASDSLDSFAIYGYLLFADTDLCCGRDYIYFENYRNAHELEVFSYSGSPVKSYTLPGTLTGLTAACDNGAYAAVNNDLYRVSGTGCEKLGGSKVKPPLLAADNRVIVSGFGEAYILNGNRIERVFQIDADHQAFGACVIHNILYYPAGSVLNGYDINSGEHLYSYSCDSAVQALYAFGDRILALCDSGDRVLSFMPSDFSYLRQSGKPDSVDRGGNSNSGGTGISSDLYKLDHTHYTISGIPAGTTVSAFLSHIRYDGYSVTLYRNNTERKSGNVGTAMTAVFRKAEESVTYALSVRGDLTGEGNMNTRDLSVLMDYLICSADFNGVYLLSADLSNNGTIDVIDVALMKRSI